MKRGVIPMYDRILHRKQAIIKTINYKLKDIVQILKNAY